jgi:hypothetical protein
MQAGSEDQIPGSGWAGFAAVMFFVLGAFNVIDGLAAVAEDENFVADELLIGDLTVWGIVMIAIGLLQLYTAYALFDDRPSGVTIGIGLAAFNLIAQLFFLPAYPIWSVLIMVIDVLLIYGLTVYGHHFGGRRHRA